MVVEFFLFGTFWFWALLIVEVVLVLSLVNYERGVGAAASLFAFGALLQWCGDVDILAFCWQHPWYLLPSLAAYLLLGVAWGIFMWRRYVLSRVRRLSEIYSEFLRTNHLPPDTKELTTDQRAMWQKHLSDCHWHRNEAGEQVQEVPQVRNHKAKIISWMSLWVFSIVLFLFKDMVVETFQVVYRYLSTYLQKIADDLYKGFKANLPS